MGKNMTLDEVLQVARESIDYEYELDYQDYVTGEIIAAQFKEMKLWH